MYLWWSLLVSNNEVLAAIEGNPYRDVWKAACWKMSQEVYFLYFLELAEIGMLTFESVTKK